VVLFIFGFTNYAVSPKLVGLIVGFESERGKFSASKSWYPWWGGWPHAT